MLEIVSEYSERENRSDFINVKEVESYSGYTNDRTITVRFKSGIQLKFGPFSREAFIHYMGKLCECDGE